jgi:hypothetical protein
MKRFAVLIANTNGLEGTKIDLENFRRFLQSEKGGAWNNDEIYKPLYNPSLIKLQATLSVLKEQYFDYVVLLFSGHGGQKRETILEINGEGETISESALKGLAERQLTIFDCCRVLPQQVHDSAMNKSMETFSAFSREYLRTIIRKKYDERIMQSIPQQVTLYSCSINESSYDTPNGAVYLNYFLEYATNIQNKFKLVGTAHQEARTATKEYVYSKYMRNQTPDADLPKCLSSQQLIISINPSSYILR